MKRGYNPRFFIATNARPNVAIPTLCRPQYVSILRRNIMANTIDATIVAVFNNGAEARAAVEDLRSAGFGSDRVFVSSETGAETSTTPAPEHSRHEGGVVGWFKSLFGSEEHEHVRGYQAAVAEGRTIVSVDTPDANVNKVSEILNRHSPIDIHSDDIGSAKGIATSNVYDAGYQGSESDRLNAREELGLPVIEEDLKVGKRTVQRGGVRVYSRFSEKPVEQDVRLREEHVRVDRQPVNRPVTEADLRAGRDEVIEVAEYAEEPVVAKEARVVEEVRVRKDAAERTEHISDTVRRNDVQVENLNAGNAEANDYRNANTRWKYPGSKARRAESLTTAKMMILITATTSRRLIRPGTMKITRQPIDMDRKRRAIRGKRPQL